MGGVTSQMGSKGLQDLAFSVEHAANILRQTAEESSRMVTRHIDHSLENLFRQFDSSVIDVRKSLDTTSSGLQSTLTHNVDSIRRSLEYSVQGVRNMVDGSTSTLSHTFNQNVDGMRRTMTESVDGVIGTLETSRIAVERLLDKHLFGLKLMVGLCTLTVVLGLLVAQWLYLKMRREEFVNVQLEWIGDDGVKRKMMWNGPAGKAGGMALLYGGRNGIGKSSEGMEVEKSIKAEWTNDISSRYKMGISSMFSIYVIL